MILRIFFLLFLFNFYSLCFSSEEFYLFDVGQGSCHFAVYKKSEIGILFDAGSKNSRKLGKIKELQTSLEETLFFYNKKTAIDKTNIEKNKVTERQYNISTHNISDFSLSQSKIEDIDMTFDRDQYDEKSNLIKTREEIYSAINKYKLKHLFVFLSHPDEDHINLITKTKKGKSIFPDGLSITAFLSGDFLGHASSDVSSVLKYLFTRDKTWVELPYYWNYKGSLMPKKENLKKINTYASLKEEIQKGDLDDVYSLFEDNTFPNNIQVRYNQTSNFPYSLDWLLSYTKEKTDKRNAFSSHITQSLPADVLNDNPFTYINSNAKNDMKNIKVYSMNRMFGNINSQSSIMAFYFPSLTLEVVCTGDSHPESFDHLSPPIKLGEKKYCTALILPHHGSSKNFSPKMIEVFQPDIFLISAGLTSYEHPEDSLIKAYRELYEQLKLNTNFFSFYGRFGSSQQIATCISRIGKQGYNIVKNSGKSIPFICTNLRGTIYVDEQGFKSDFENIIKVNNEYYSIDFSKQHKLPNKTHEKITSGVPFILDKKLFYPINSMGKFYFYHLHKHEIDDAYEDVKGINFSPQIINKEVENEIKTSALLEFSNRYIQDIRNADSEKGEVLWGGDIELAEIGQVLGVKFIVHQYSRNSQGKIRTDISGNLIVESNETQPVGDENGYPIHLWLDGFHYQNYDPKSNKVIDVPKDGNCLFHAVLRAIEMQSTPQNISWLRNQIADRYSGWIEKINKGETVSKAGSEENNFAPIDTVLTHENDNPIYIRFSAIFEAENDIQLQNAIQYLPPGSLVNEVINLRNYFVLE